MWYYDISDIVKVQQIKVAIEGIQGWDDSPDMMDIVIHCQDFLAAAKVTEETDKHTFGEYSRRMKRNYEWLKQNGAGL